MILKVYGKASKKIIKEIEITNKVSKENLMNFLREKEIPIASSCYGEGICRKCIVNKDLLSCQIYLDQVIQNYISSNSSKNTKVFLIEIDYL